MAYTSRLDFGPYGDFGTMMIPTSKESSMPWAVAAPAIATVAGAGISALSGRSATKAQTKANDAALAYQREQDTMNRADWEKAMRAYEARRNVLLQRYDVSVPQDQPPWIPQAQPQMAVGGPGMGAPVMPPGQEMRRGPMQGRPLRGIPGNLGAFARGGYTGRGPAY